MARVLLVWEGFLTADYTDGTDDKRNGHKRTQRSQRIKLAAQNPERFRACHPAVTGLPESNSPEFRDITRTGLWGRLQDTDTITVFDEAMFKRPGVELDHENLEALVPGQFESRDHVGVA